MKNTNTYLLKIAAVAALFLWAEKSFSQSMSISSTGVAPDGSAMLDIISTSKGLLIPRMTMVQRNAISSPATSLMIYQTDNTPGYYYNSGTPASPVWTLVGASITGSGTTNYLARWTSSSALGIGVSYDNGTNVGISNTSPGARLDVTGPATGTGITIRAAGGGDVVLNSGGSLFFDGNYSYAAGNYIRPIGGANTMGFFTSGLERMRIISGGNVGVGSTSPSTKFVVNGGKTTLSRGATYECCGNDATLAIGEATTTDGMRASISFHNGGEAEGTIRLIQNAVGSVGTSSRRIQFYDNQSQGLGLEISGGLFFGNGNSRSQTRTNAGLQGNSGAQSGFYENDGVTVTNFPTGASGWWHLLDVRHSNPANNYAMQFAGSFFDQDVYVRKTNNNASQAWTKILTAGNSYGSNIQFVSPTSDISTSSSTYADMSGVTITFIPIHATVLVTFTAAGNYTGSSGYSQFAHFKIVKDGVDIKGASTTVGEDAYYSYTNTWGVAFVYPVSVTPGVSTTIKIQWARFGGNGTQTVWIRPSVEPVIHHRTLTILD